MSDSAEEVLAWLAGFSKTPFNAYVTAALPYFVVESTLFGTLYFTRPSCLC